jgi:hypothetical protein
VTSSVGQFRNFRGQSVKEEGETISCSKRTGNSHSQSTEDDNDARKRRRIDASSEEESKAS